jgi:hypothetical protein
MTPMEEDRVFEQTVLPLLSPVVMVRWIERTGQDDSLAACNALLHGDRLGVVPPPALHVLAALEENKLNDSE